MRKSVVLMLAAALLSGCASVMVWRSAGISGQVRLVDAKGTEVKGNLKDITVNIINVSAGLTGSAGTAVTDETGHFLKVDLTPGAYKLEVVKEGYRIATADLQLGGHERKSLKFDLTRLRAEKRQTIEMKKGQEEINNPGQVNIQPPSI